MTSIDPSDVVTKLDDRDYLADLIRKAGTKGVGPNLANETSVASQVYVGLCLRTSLADLTAALQASAKASTEHAQKLTWATVGLVLATFTLVAATLLPVFMSSG